MVPENAVLLKRMRKARFASAKTKIRISSTAPLRTEMLKIGD
jgi:hypothetical protein